MFKLVEDQVATGRAYAHLIPFGVVEGQPPSALAMAMVS
jgi:hypothetical protein